MLLSRKALLLAMNAGVKVQDAFSTTLYTGNGSTQTITNGIDLAGEGGLVWIKNRTGTTYGHTLIDTSRGDRSIIQSNNTNAALTGDLNFVFTNSGFQNYPANNVRFNASGGDYASWTFRQAPKFFDIVQYTGDGTSGRQIAHDLGIEPGMMVVKKINTTGPWIVYHKSLGATKCLYLSGTSPFETASNRWNDTEPTSTDFVVASSTDVNSVGNEYIAYLFAHDPSDSGIIQCGSYTGNGSTNGPVIDLGWQPQWLLYKRTDSTGNWYVIDVDRGFESYLRPNTSESEVVLGSSIISATATGFQINASGTDINASGGTYIYMAIAAPQ